MIIIIINNDQPTLVPEELRKQESYFIHACPRGAWVAEGGPPA